MNKVDLFNKVSKVEAYASTSKLSRLVKNPIKYIFATLYSKVVYKWINCSLNSSTTTFWNAKMNILLPSAIDIYLAGGKTHSSEIRLTKYLINNLEENSIFFDIGAHFGYFSLLASQIITRGKIVSIEASNQTYKILKDNIKNIDNICSYNIAFSDIDGTIEFNEFPTLYSEYNTLEQNQYINEKWYNPKRINKIRIISSTGDSFISNKNINPDFIKIDVEGAEDKVILGLSNLISNYYPIIIMEFGRSSRGNSNHVKADLFLKENNYKAYLISNDGSIKLIPNSTKDYVDSLYLNSDNIVYKKIMS